MNKYLEKLAESSAKRKSSTHAAVGGLIGGTLLGSAVMAPISRHYGSKLMESMNREGVSDLGTVKRFLRDSNLKTRFNLRPHALEKKSPSTKRMLESLRHSRTPAYSPFGDTIIGVKRPNGSVVNTDIVMHELGHAQDFSRNRGLKIAETIISRHPLSSLATFGATAAALRDEETRAYAPAIAAVPGVLTMRSEGAANYHSYKGVKKHKGELAASKYLRTLVKNNTLNYLASVSVPVLGAYLAGKILDATTSTDES